MRATAFAVVLAFAAPAGATEYFVDATGGSNGNSGTSQQQAWQTLSPVNAATFAAGDVVAFRRGGVWTEGLRVRQSGQPGSPITFAAYGDGPAPTFEAPAGDAAANAIRVEGVSHVVLDGLAVRSVHGAGIVLAAGSSGVVVRGCEATDVGTGVSVAGQGNRVTGCHIHDLHMVTNTPGGPDGGDNDDYGAVGVLLRGTDHEVDHNRFERCIAPSYDYGTDGGAVETWRSVQRCRIHHNVAVDTNGFCEIGGTAGDVVSDNVLAYNVAIDTRGFGWYHMSGTFGVTLTGLRIENNTIVDTTDTWTIFGFSAVPDASTASIRNNIVVTNGGRVAERIGFTHDHNLFLLTGGGQLGFALGAQERVADPKFVSATDLHLQATSPALNAGEDLGWTEDVEGNAVPQGGAPELGAYELPAGGVDAGAPLDAGAPEDAGARLDAGALRDSGVSLDAEVSSDAAGLDGAPSTDVSAPADAGPTSDDAAELADTGGGPLPGAPSEPGYCGCGTPGGVTSAVAALVALLARALGRRRG